METIVATDITKVFHRPSRLIALRNFSHSFARGSTTIITGPNGAGKSTLLKIISGLLAPDSGDIHGTSGAQIGFFTSNINVYANLTVAETTALMLPSHDSIQPDLSKYVETKMHNRPVRNLSKGQQIRFALFLAFALGSDLLLLDEPTTHLDKAGKILLLEELAGYSSTIVLATHEPELFTALPRQRHLHLEQGEIRT